MEALKAEARSQAGVLHRNQLIANGLSGEDVRKWAAVGWLEPRFRWTYAFPGTGHGLLTQAWSAQLSAGGDTAATSSHALALLEVISPLPGPFEGTRSKGETRRQSGLIVHKTDYLTEDDVTTVDGVRCAKFPRATLDLSARGDADLIARTVDRGAQLQLFDGQAFDRLREHYPRAPGWPILDGALAGLNETTGRNAPSSNACSSNSS